MTRINASIQPYELTDQHLLAEIRELPRILNTVKSGKAKIENKTDIFKLGSGHVTFFYPRLQFLVSRHKELIKEANFRRFQTLNYSESYENLPKHLLNDWKPTNTVREILKERVNERLAGMKNLKRNRLNITLEEALIK